MNGKIYAMILAGVLCATPVFASEGGEGNNTGCNGQGNPNSPCEGGGNGGIGHPKPGVISQIKNKSSNTNVNLNESVAVSAASASAAASSNAAAQQSQSGNSNNIGGDTLIAPAPAPSVYAPALAVAPETCMGSTSAGASGSNGVLGFGISFGTTWKSEDCELRMFARSLQALGETKAALALLSQNEKVAAALKEAASK